VLGLKIRIHLVASGNGVTGVFSAQASDLHDRIKSITGRYDVKAGHGWEGRCESMSE
jgi:hypothetical protein